MSAVRWGMLSTAGIGHMVSSAVRGSADTRFVAVASRDAAKARGFAGGAPPRFGRADAVEQAVVIETVRRAAREGAAADVPDVTPPGRRVR